MHRRNEGESRFSTSEAIYGAPGDPSDAGRRNYRRLMPANAGKADIRLTPINVAIQNLRNGEGSPYIE